MQAALGDGIAFVIHDIANLQVTEYMQDGAVIQYSSDASGQRVRKLIGDAPTYWSNRSL